MPIGVRQAVGVFDSFERLKAAFYDLRMASVRSASIVAVAIGGVLMWMRVADAEKERLAVTIMKENSGRDVHVHSWSR